MTSAFREILPTKIDQYQVLSLIAQGGQAKVYLCTMNGQNLLLSIKVYEGDNSEESFKKEVMLLQSLNHDHIVGILGFHPEASIVYDKKTPEKRPIIILEYANYGDLHHLVKENQGLSERTSKFIFLRILKAIKYLDDKRISHRDIKLDNILLDKNFNVKLIDFGLSSELKKEINGENFKENVGTEYGKAPETYKSNFSCEKLDIFAVGVLLFSMLFGKLPFGSSRLSNKEYSYFRNKNENEFWKCHRIHSKKNNDPKFQLFSLPEFKSLMNSFFNSNPDERPKYESVFENQWLITNVATETETAEELKEIYEKSVEGEHDRSELLGKIRRYESEMMGNNF